MERLYLPWGKTVKGDNPDIYHPALYHMYDAGNVAHSLLSAPASPRWRKVLSNSFGISPDEVLSIIPFLIAIHDIGKISADFQSQSQEQKQRLCDLGFAFGRVTGLRHTAIGQVFIHFLSDEQLPKAIRLIARDAAGGHHGEFSWKEWKSLRALLQRDEPDEWQKIREQSLAILLDMFKTRIEIISNISHWSAAVMALTGFTTLCDWIASDTLNFPANPSQDPAEYFKLSQVYAEQAIEKNGFLQAYRSNTGERFTEIFPSISSPRPLQRAVDDIPEEILRTPSLTIIEAPTGEGKTEAALALAHRIAQNADTNEIYYALPTSATSNQMFLRVQKFLTDNLGLKSRVRLVHNQAMLYQDEMNVELYDDGYAVDSQTALEWFSPKKRALLSPFGVGTIDQAELGALNTRHNSLRLLGLSGKVVIIDEVHAYDTYMTTIIERLLQWLHALGTSVILLSATLPTEKTRILISAYGSGEIENPVGLRKYPSIDVMGNGISYTANPQPFQEDKTIELETLFIQRDDPDSKAQLILDKVKNGGVACWITNTIRGAQTLYSELKSIAPEDTDLSLIHSRYPVIARLDKENALTQKYGPNGRRPKKGIVIGTQVLEQSLDLDFDYMITDLAPIDLILQRAGRLHRHQRVRLEQHKHARLGIALSQSEDGKILAGADRYVYDEYYLLATWLLLKDRKSLKLPADYRVLIEEVYAVTPPSSAELQAAYGNLLKSEKAAAALAGQRLFPMPETQDTFCSKLINLTFEDNETKAGWMIAQTRLAEKSITILPLTCVNDEEYVTMTGQKVTGNQDISYQDQMNLVRQTIKVSHRLVVNSLLQKPRIDTFKKSALLRDVIPLVLDENRQALLTSNQEIIQLVVDDELGLTITKMKG